MLALRDPTIRRIHPWIVLPDGASRDLPELAGELGGLAVDGDRLIVAHTIGDGGERLGVISVLPLDGGSPPIARRWTHGSKYGPLALTRAGLFAGRVAEVDAVLIGDVAGDAMIDLRPLGTGLVRDGNPEWIGREQVVIDSTGRLERRRVEDGSLQAVLPARGVLIGRAGDELLVRGDLATGAPGSCTIAAVSDRAVRTVAIEGCATPTAVRCNDRGRCVLERAGDDTIGLAWLDPRTGAVSADVLRLPTSDSPHVDVAADGRWLVESGGELAIVDPATGATTPLPTTMSTVDDAIWGHDGSYLIAVGQRDGAATLARVALDGTLAVLARSRAGTYVSPRLTADGTRLAVRHVDRPFEYLLFPTP